MPRWARARRPIPARTGGRRLPSRRCRATAPWRRAGHRRGGGCRGPRPIFGALPDAASTPAASSVGRLVESIQVAEDERTPVAARIPDPGHVRESPRPAASWLPRIRILRDAGARRTARAAQLGHQHVIEEDVVEPASAEMPGVEVGVHVEQGDLRQPFFEDGHAALVVFKASPPSSAAHRRPIGNALPAAGAGRLLAGRDRSRHRSAARDAVARGDAGRVGAVEHVAAPVRVHGLTAGGRCCTASPVSASGTSTPGPRPSPRTPCAPAATARDARGAARRSRRAAKSRPTTRWSTLCTSSARPRRRVLEVRHDRAPGSAGEVDARMAAAARCCRRAGRDGRPRRPPA